MKKFLYLEKIPLIKIIIGNILWVTGFCSLLFINITLGPGFLVVWSLFIIVGLYLISTDGIELDFNENQYRQVFSIAGSNFGIWKDFPNIDYITIFKTTITQTIGGKTFGSTATATMSDKMVLINLFAENKKPTTLYMTKNPEMAIEIAKKFHEFYNIEVINKMETKK
ncbi:hypothetical protein ABGT15_13070 [Flavobacterium enshiense]|uniref:hypothetical protein n=1 Tax=Flavobacterium enshiense TaxID=1341165 RepID=UPI00345CA92D